jgi:hypothetical protein
MGSIFHYTDAAGLVGILSSNSLFATHYRCLNDSTEAAVIRDLLMPILIAEIGDITPKLVERGWLKKEFYEQYGTAGHQTQAEALYRAVTSTVDNVSPFFVLSFCRHDEGSEQFSHGLLSQWRGYADGGGVAIEFDEAKIDALMNAEEKTFVYGVTKTSDVLYEKYESLFKPEQFRGLASAMLGRLFDKDTSEVTGKKNIDEAVRDYILIAPFLKHLGFREEREYRMVLAPVRKKSIIKGHKGLTKPIEFRVRNGLVVPYIEMFKSFDQPLPIKSIIVGPHAHQEVQEDAIRIMAEHLGVELVIRRSEIPFRR